MASIAPGTVLGGKWVLGDHLGTGGAGTVYAATHRNGTRAAVKILHPALANDEEQVARFLREGTIANLIGHHGAVAALDDDRTEDGTIYLVLELLDGTSLADVIADRAPMPVAEALDITDKLLDVLVAAHEKAVVHRDVKPGNVLVLPNGSIKLLDFGIARSSAGSAIETRMGAVFGTPGFMPPEQARGRTELVDARTDVWAASAVLFAMLTGERLHAATTTNESLARAMLEGAPPIRRLVPSLPDVVARLVDRGLSFHREDRFQSAARMQGAVRFARDRLRGSTASELPRPLAAPAADESRSDWRARSAIGGLALTAVVLGSLWLALVLDGFDAGRAPAHGVVAAAAEPALAFVPAPLPIGSTQDVSAGDTQDVRGTSSIPAIPPRRTRAQRHEPGDPLGSRR